MRILVTGGSGFIGQRVVNGLLSKGHQAVVFSRQPRISSTQQQAGASMARGDIRIFSDLLKAVNEHQVDRIIHVAYALTAEGEANPMLALQVNVLGASNVFEAARLTGVDRVVFCSSIAAYAAPDYYGDRPVTEDEDMMKPVSIYGATKVLNEFMASRFEVLYGTVTPVLRISAVYGTGRAERGVTAWTSQMVAAAVEGRPVFIKLRPDQLSNFIFVDDVGEQLIRLALADSLKHRVFNSGGYTSTPSEFAAIVCKYYPELKVNFDPQAPKWPYPHKVDGSRLENEIGYKVRSPEEGLLEQINQVRAGLGQASIAPI